MSITLNPQINHFLSNDKIITAQPQWQYLLPTVMALPRAQQWSTLQKIRLSVMNKKSENTSDNNKAGGAEEWNTNFSSTSLYEALSKLTFMQQIYKVNRGYMKPLRVAKIGTLLKLVVEMEKSGENSNGPLQVGVLH